MTWQGGLGHTFAGPGGVAVARVTREGDVWRWRVWGLTSLGIPVQRTGIGRTEQVARAAAAAWRAPAGAL